MLAGKSKLVKDISANTVQSVATQVLGLLIFYLTSKYLGKSEFGELNWSMAVASTCIAIASLGLDLVFVRKIAAGENVIKIGGIHFFHSLAAGLFVCLIALSIEWIQPGFSRGHPFFFLIMLTLAIANIANSFKLCMNGLEAYSRLAVLAVLTNVLKLSAMVVLFITGYFTLRNVVFVLLFTSAVEVALGYLSLNLRIKATLIPAISLKPYRLFVMEALPQLGVVLFDSALARIDWILLGVIGTAAATADYSFTYKVFELSKLPLLIIAPVLLTRFSRILRQGGIHVTKQNIERSKVFLQLEMFVVMLIPIFLVMCWTPLIDYFTDNKYGAVNEKVYWMLALCVPLAAMVNYLWTLGFAQGQLRTIMIITVLASVINVVANLLLIPVIGTYGAALSYLISVATQLILYLRFIRRDKITLDAPSCLAPVLAALAAVILAKLITDNVIFATSLAVGVYVFAGLLGGMVKPQKVAGFLKDE